MAYYVAHSSGLLLPDVPGAAPTSLVADDATPEMSTTGSIGDNIVAVTLNNFSLGNGTWRIFGPSAAKVRLGSTNGNPMQIQSAVASPDADIWQVSVGYLEAGMTSELICPLEIIVKTPISNTLWSVADSTLGWASGSWSQIDDIDKLRGPVGAAVSARRPQKVFGSYSTNAGYNKSKASDLLSRWRNNDQQPWAKFKAAEGRAFFNWGLRVFPTGAVVTNGVFTLPAGTSLLTAWPSGQVLNTHYVNPGIPPGYSASAALPAVTEQYDRAIDVWQKLADGKFDDVLSAQFIGIKDAAIADGIWGVSGGDKYIIVRHAWEANREARWGSTHSINAGGAYGWANTNARKDVVLAAWRRLKFLMRNVHPNFLMHMCPLWDGPDDYGMSYYFDKLATTNVGESNLLLEIIGPDVYDTQSNLGVTTGTYAQRWNFQKTSRSHGGLDAWMAKVKLQANRGQRFGTGEWGVANRAVPPYDDNLGGNDDPEFIHGMFQFFKTNKQYMAYEWYFNKDPPHYLTEPTNTSPTARHPNASQAYRDEMRPGGLADVNPV